MKTVMIVILLLVGVGCASKPAEKRQPPPTVEQVLSSTLGEADYGKPERCLQLSAYNTIEVLDKQHILFEGLSNKVWLNKLRTPCPGLRKDAVLRLDVRSSSLCNLDSVTAIDPRLFYLDRVSATCSLGEFIPIPKEQAEFLKKEIRGK